MPQPTQTQVHVDTLLDDVLIGFKNADYIADRSAPIKMVNKQTNFIAKNNQSAFFRDEAKIRSAGSKSARGGWTVDNTTTYYVPRYSLAHEIPDEVRSNTDVPYDQDRDAAFYIYNAIQLARERAFATAAFGTGIWGTNKVGNTDFNQWSNYAGSFPLDDVVQWKDAVEQLIGIEPRCAIIGKGVWAGSGGLSNGGGLKNHPTVIDAIKYTQKGILSVDLVASLMELDELTIGRAIFTSSVEGTAEASVTYTRIFGKHCLLYNKVTPGINTAPALTTFVWDRVANAIQYIKRWREEPNEADVLEGNSYFTHKVLVANAGLFASAVVN